MVAATTFESHLKRRCQSQSSRVRDWRNQILPAMAKPKGETAIVSRAKPRESRGENHESGQNHSGRSRIVVYEVAKVPLAKPNRDPALRGPSRHGPTGTSIMRYAALLLCYGLLLLHDWQSGREIQSRNTFPTATLQDESPAAKSSWGNIKMFLTNRMRFVAPLQEHTFSNIQMVLQHCHCQCQQ